MPDIGLIRRMNEAVESLDFSQAKKGKMRLRLLL